MSEKKALAKAMVWNTAGNLVYCICQWVITILAVKLDSFGAAGYLSLAMSTSSTFSTIALFSMRNYQVSDVRNEFKDTEYIGSRIITCTAAVVFCAIYAIFSTSIYQMLCIDAFMMIRLAESAVDVIHGIDQKYNRYDLIGKSYVLRGVATDIAFIAGFLFFHDVLTAIAITGVINIALIFFFDMKQTGKLEKLSFVIKDKRIAVLLKKCAPIVITGFLMSLIPLLPRTALQTMLGNDVLGVYSSIASPTLVVQVFAAYAFNPLVPKISVLYNEKRYDSFLAMFHKTVLFFIGFAFVVYFGAALLGRWGLQLLYGKVILDSYELFMPLVWCTILTGYLWIMISIVTAIRKILPMMLAMASGFVLCYLFTNPCITSFGANGASYIQMISFTIVFIEMIIITEVTVWKKKYYKTI